MGRLAAQTFEGNAAAQRALAFFNSNRNHFHPLIRNRVPDNLTAPLPGADKTKIGPQNRGRVDKSASSSIGYAGLGGEAGTACLRCF
jgi:hypothetical protein